MNYATTLFATAAFVAFSASFALADGHAFENPDVGGAAMFEDKNIIDNAVNSADHTTLVAAVQAAQLVDTLKGEGPFTVFAPTNAAFEALPDGTVENLLLPENKEELAKILSCHVVGKDVLADALYDMIIDDGGEHPVPTLGGCTWQASFKYGAILLKDENGGTASVTIADVRQSNGVIHVIDAVLLPEG